MPPFTPTAGSFVLPQLSPDQLTAPRPRYQSYRNKYYSYYRPSYNPYFPCVSREIRDKWLVNLTGEVIPDDVLDIACLGKQFGVPIIRYNKLPVPQIIATIESQITSIPQEERENVREVCVDVVSNFQRQQRPPRHPNLLVKVKAAWDFKKSRPDILFLKADKGNVTVAITRELYLSKMAEHLTDAATYKVMTTDPTPGIQKKVNRIVTHWHNQNFITDAERGRMRSAYANIALAYGQPKIHKKGTPFRMIVSFIGTPTYRLAQYLQRVLLDSLREETQTAAVSRKTVITNSISLVRKLRALNLPDDFAMISMDVVSLFTNVPLPLVIAGIRRRWEVIRKHTKVSQDEFVDAVALCFNASAFQFNGVMYQQTFGAAMGSPLSPVVAEIVLHDLENYCMARLDFPVYFYTRYVDDVLVFLPRNRAASILACFNDYHPKLQFTLETEVERRINFLEVTLIREKGTVRFDWFRKPTSSGRYLNYYSHHPKSQKIGTIYNLIDRAIMLADPEFHLKNLAFVRQSLVQNGYPGGMVKSTIYRRQEFFLLPKNYNGDAYPKRMADADERPARITLPYVEGLSEELQQSLSKFRIRLSFRNDSNLRFLFAGDRDVRNRLRCVNTVYSISCRVCRFIFIDHTKKPLGEQIARHYESLRGPQTAVVQNRLTEHAFRYQHDFDFDGVKVLGVERNSKARQLLALVFREQQFPEADQSIDKISSVSQTYSDLFN